MRYIDEKQKIKLSHNKVSDNISSLDYNTINSSAQKESDKVTLLVTNVTVCLAVHNECSGKYIDSTGKFVVKCLCSCHFIQQKVYRSKK